MNLEKLKPWNWFKHEENPVNVGDSIPVTRQQEANVPALGGRPQSLVDFHREVDRLLDNVFTNAGIVSRSADTPSASMARRFYRPQIDVVGSDKHYEIALDVPGLAESDISIDMANDVLTIRGKKEEQKEEKEKHFYRIERSYGSFQRTLSLPDDADTEAIQASLKDGVLTLTIPRQQAIAQNTKRIPISS